MKSLCAVAVLGALVSGCTPYKRMGLMGGYRDMEVSPGVHQITVRGNAFTSIDRLTGHFHRRAKEICDTKGYPAYDWRVGADVLRGPSTFTVQRNALTGGYNVTENPGWKKGLVEGLVMCTEAPPAAATAPVDASARLAPVP